MSSEESIRSFPSLCYVVECPRERASMLDSYLTASGTWVADLAKAYHFIDAKEAASACEDPGCLVRVVIEGKLA